MSPGVAPAVLGVLLALLAVLINALANGNAFLAVLPTLMVGGVWAVWRLPLRYTVSTVLFLALVLDNPSDRPQQGRWRSIFYPPGEVFYNNLHNLTGISALRFSLLEVLVAFLGVVAVARALRGSGEDGNPGARAAKPLRQALWVYVGALLAFSALGLLRGGNGQQLLWQIRQLAWLPVLTFLAMRAFGTRRDQWRLSAVILLAALCRAAEGIYYYAVVCRPLNYKPEYVTTHGDSLLFVAAFMIGVLCLLERPGVFSALVGLGVLPPVGLALVYNNRRLAFVCLLVALVTVALSTRKPVKRTLLRLTLASLPLGAVYVAVGWNSTSKFFAPITRLRSAADPKDASNQTRDIENGNLILTVNQSPLLGSGFGHEYIERVHAYDIQKVFPQYRYIAHNSVLWLWSQTGMVGFFLLWLPLLLGMFLALRSYHHAATTTSRVVALTTVTVLVCYIGHAYGDMGLQSWTATLVLSAWLGATGRLAVATGAWPQEAAAAVKQASWPAAGSVMEKVDPGFPIHGQRLPT